VLKGADIYNPADNLENKEVTPFKYMPIVAFLFAPLALLDEKTASLFWHIINFFLLIGVFYYSRNLIVTKKISARGNILLYLIAALSTITFIIHNFDSGQINTLMLFLLTFGLYLINKGRQVPAAALLSLSIMAKYLPALFIPYFLIKKRFKLVFLIAGFFILYLALPGLFIGLERNTQLLKKFVPFISQTSLDTGSLITYKNQSLLAGLSRFLSKGSWYSTRMMTLDFWSLRLISLAICLLMYSIAIYPKKEGGFSLDYALLFICMPLFNPNAWMHNFISLIFPSMLLLYYLIVTRFKDKAILAFFFLALFLNNLSGINFGGLFTKETFYIFGALTISALILYWAVALIKFDKARCSYL
jgi:hypothetical protein